MKQSQRIRILKSLAQTVGAPATPANAGAPATAPGTTTTTTSTDPATITQSQPGATPAQATVDIRAVPGFRPELFKLRPDLINDMNQIVNIVNGYLLKLSNNVVSFSMTWTSPSIEGSNYVNSLKNLFNIAKWLYSVVKSQTPYYTMDGLRKIAADLITSTNSYSFPEPTAMNAKSDIVNVAKTMLSKLGALK